MSKYYFSKCHNFLSKKIQIEKKNIELYIGVDPRSSGGHLRIIYCLLIFKACRLWHPDFEIKFIDFFASNVIKTAFISKNAFDNYLYIA